MKKNSHNHNRIERYGLILIGIVLSAFFWILEAGAHVFIFQDTGFVELIFKPEIHEAWMRFIVVSMFICFGLFSQWIVVARKRAEEALVSVNSELTQIFETSADGMRVVDREFKVLRANETFSSLSGLKKTDIIGKKCYDVFSGPICRTPECPLIRVLSNEERVESDVEKMRTDGTKIPCIVTATTFRSPSGDLIGIVEDFKDISERKEYENELMESRERLRELTSHLQLVREEERTQIAREIHDELGQSLAALKMDLSWLNTRLNSNEKHLIAKTKSMTGLVDATVQSVKKISSKLRPFLLDDFGLSAAMEWQTEEFESRTSIECNFISNPEDIVLNQEYSIAVFRIYQEALTNITRHSNATRVNVKIKETNSSIFLIVQDNGIGICEDQIKNPRSFGIIGMRERTHILGGQFRITSRLRKGTSIVVSIPLKKKV